MKRGRTRVGTSGWQYAWWRGVLYPRGLATTRWLPRYASAFDCVEVNATFYKLQTRETLARWREATPDGFVFACKGSRFLTHMKRLLISEEGIERFFAPLEGLGPKLGPVLFQLPPQMTRADPERLDRFLAALPRGPRFAFEFRAEGWYSREICDVLDAHGAAFCEHDLVPRHPPRVTGGFRYVRFHGATGKYAGRYGRDALRGHARSYARSAAKGIDTWIFFNNDTAGHALFDARDLVELLGGRIGLELGPDLDERHSTSSSSSSPSP